MCCAQVSKIPGTAAIFALIAGSLFVPALALGQSRDARDRRITELTHEVEQLKRTILEQDRRITQLEKDVKALQVSSVPGPIPPLIPLWHAAANWNQIKAGMSRAQIVDILGAPTRETTVLDVQTLYYAPDSRSSSTLSGTITLVGDRLTSMMPPSFEK